MAIGSRSSQRGGSQIVSNTAISSSAVAVFLLCQTFYVGSADAQAEDSIYTVNLFGSFVVPGPGYPGGEAKALIMVSGRLGNLAYWIHGINTTEPISAFLYAGSATEFGPPLIRLLDKGTTIRNGTFGEAGYSFFGTQRLDLKFAEYLTQQPQNYYIQISTTNHPKGACRGQLSSTRGTASINIGG